MEGALGDTCSLVECSILPNKKNDDNLDCKRARCTADLEKNLTNQVTLQSREGEA